MFTHESADLHKSVGTPRGQVGLHKRRICAGLSASRKRYGAAWRALVWVAAVSDYLSIPSDLPVPEDDGAADHLPGTTMPHIVLPSTGGHDVALDRLGPGRSVLYIYPMTGVPGVDLPEGWNEIPGARGCTPEACGFRDHHAELRAAGVSTVYGMSSQSTAYQAELAERLGLPFEILSDTGHELADVLDLPTFTTGGDRLYKRLTMVVDDGRIEHVFYPIFPPDEHAAQVLDWLSGS
jgi:peroxiredoxin